jgi:hypothetical protein
MFSISCGYFQNNFVNFDHIVAEIMLDKRDPLYLYICIYAQKLSLQPSTININAQQPSEIIRTLQTSGHESKCKVALIASSNANELCKKYQTCMKDAKSESTTSAPGTETADEKSYAKEETVTHCATISGCSASEMFSIVKQYPNFNN